MPRVIVLDNLAPPGLEILQRAPGIEYEVRTGLAGDALRAALTEFEGALCRSGVKITAAALAGNRRLKAIVRAGVGTDNIDLAAATRAGIVVMNTPTGNTVSTAEHTLAMMLALSRNVAAAHASLSSGKWERNRFMGAQVADKSLGIIGLGRVGQAVAVRAKAFGMKLFGFDPYLSPERAKELGVETVSNIREMLPKVDYLTVHTPLSPETENLIGRDELALLPRGARLVNCARGGIYDEAALAEALQSGHIAGVALDVFREEPCTASPLFGLPGVLVTPHLGASTEEAQTSVAVEGAQLLADFLTEGTIKHAVNTPPIDPQTLEGLHGELDVAYRLGLLHAQMDRGAIRACRLTYRGQVAGKRTKLLTAAFAVGLLENALVEGVNLINAEMLLHERGIELVEHLRSDMGDFSSLIVAEVETEQKTYTAAGTLFGSLQRLVQLGEFRLDAYLDGTMLVFTHDDVPGIIGLVGTIFGRHRVNIAQMAVGRAAPGGAAIGVLNLDAPPPPEALAEVLAHPHIQSATVIRLPTPHAAPPWRA